MWKGQSLSGRGSAVSKVVLWAFILSVSSLPVAMGQSEPAAPGATAGSKLAQEVEPLTRSSAVIEGFAPGNANGEARVEYDVCFAGNDEQPLHCDVYLPAPNEAVSASPFPVMLLVHGGGWTMGDKWMPAGYARLFAEAGIASVVVNYRLAPQHKFPAQVDDIRAAMLWTKENAAAYGWDPARMGLFGYSAGAHLCLMIGTLSDEPLQTQHQTSGWAHDDDRWSDLPKPSLVVAGGAPCDFRSLPPQNHTLAYFLGGSRQTLPEIYRYASPAAHVSPGDVPTLFIHGSHDLIVPMHDSRKMYEQQSEAGVASRYVEITGHGHLVTFQHPQAKQATLDFVRAQLLGAE